MEDVKVSVKTTFHTQEIQKLIENACESGLTELANQIEQTAYHMVAVKTGALRDSIEVIKNDKASMDIVAGNEKVDYALIQEMGEKKGRQYKFTPFLRPAFYNCTSDANIREIFQKRLDNLGLHDVPTIRKIRHGKIKNIGNIHPSILR
jgi:CRISPR/Cas system CSM-associated protein Csm2 small subunit